MPINTRLFACLQGTKKRPEVSGPIFVFKRILNTKNMCVYSSGAPWQNRTTDWSLPWTRYTT